MKLAIFVSGSGSLLPGFFKMEAEQDNFEIKCVVADRQCEGIIKAEAAGKKTRVTDQFNEELIAYLAEQEVDTICLAGFLKILPAEFINKFPGKIYNTHPSLLPEFGGQGMYGSKVHQAVMEAQVPETGFTVHEVTKDVDDGPILFQKRVPVLPSDTWETIEDKVKVLERDWYPRVIANLAK